MARLTRTTPPPARLVGIVAALALAVAVLFSPAVARAEGTVDTWDGSVETTWYNASSPQTEYTITTAEQLAGLAQLVDSKNDFAGVTITLASDLDLSGHEWNPIGNGDGTPFRGTFDGQGHTISHLTLTPANPEADQNGLALFSVVQNGEIRDLVIEDASVDVRGAGAFRQSVLAVRADSSIISNCSTSGTLQSSTDFLQVVGGMVGLCTNSTTITRCASFMDITTSSASASYGETVGGLVGQWEGATDTSLISNCLFAGSIMSSADRSFVGGILSAGRPTALGGTVKSLPVVENCVVNPSSFEASGEFADLVYVGLVYGTDGAPAVETCLWPAGDEHVAGSVDYDTLAITYPADTSSYGSAAADFSDSTLIEKLNANSPDTWAMGVNGYPVLAWQTNLVAADYSGVNDALAKIPADLSLYTAESAAAVETARDAVDRTLAADRQSEVDAMAEAIEDAVAALEKLADYDAVDAAVAKAEALDRTLYAEDSLAALDKAVADVTRGYGETRQAEVDSMAEAIESALAALEYLPADYSAVDAALAKVPEDLSGYTAESAAAVEAARDAVDRTLTADRQGEVDAMAEAIEAALDALEEVPAPKPEQVAGNKDDLPATGDPTVLLVPALGLVGGAVLLARRRVA